MFMVLMGSQRQQYREQFDQLFRLRYETFVKGRNWSLPVASGAREIDQYDTPDTAYFFNLNEAGGIESSVRMTPTIKSSLLADYFPHLVENGVNPRSPDIYEATRYIVCPTQKDRTGIRRAKVDLVVGLLEWCLTKKLAFLQTVIDAGTLSSFVEMTRWTTPLGLAHPYGGGKGVPGGGECMAFRWPITLSVLEDIKTYGSSENSRRNAVASALV